MTCIRCGVEAAAGVVLVEIADANGGTFALCGACFRERVRIEPTARRGDKPAPFVAAGKREVRL